MSPRAVVITGPPASGKTTLGAALARALHHAFIDLDIVTGAMTRAALALAGADESALDGAPGARLRDARYGALFDTAAANLAAGLGVVLSGPFTRERTDPARWEAVRTRLGCSDAALICLELDEGLRRERMRARGAPRDRGKLRAPGEAAERSGAAAEPCNEAAERSGAAGELCDEAAEPSVRPAGAIRLDASAPPDVLLDAALAALGARHADAGHLFDRQGQEPSQPADGSAQRADGSPQRADGSPQRADGSAQRADGSPRC